MKLLNKKYTKYHSEHKPWKNGLLSAAVVLLFLILFQPFGFKDKDLALKLILFPVYSLLVYLHSIAKFFFVRRILNSEERWSAENELLYLAISIWPINLLVHLLSVWITGDMPFNLYWYFNLLYHVSSLLLIKTVIEFLYYSNKFADIKTEQLSGQLQLVSQQLSNAKQKPKTETASISLEKESIDINRNKMVYIKSVGNYLEFNFRESNDQIKKLIKRGRIHQAEKDLEDFPEFFRCHRAFIVNLKQAKQIKGNSKNARLVFDQNLEEIPVSRSQYSNLKEQFDKIIAG